MAGDWLKWTKGLTRKSEVVAIATALGIDRRLVASMLMELWEWADDQTENGRVKGVTPEFIDELIGIENFFSEIENVGWIKRKRGEIIFPHFERHNGKSAKRRALDSERKASVRSMSASRADNNRTREEKRREEKRKEKIKEPPKSPKGDGLKIEFPDILDTPDFRKAWDDWYAYRREAKLKAYVPLGAKKQLTILSKMGHDEAIKAIDYSIAQSWHGIHPDRSTNDGNNRASGDGDRQDAQGQGRTGYAGSDREGRGQHEAAEDRRKRERDREIPEKAPKLKCHTYDADGKPIVVYV